MSQDSFSYLGLAKPLLRAIADKGYTTPTPIQLKAIPVVLAGKDLLAAAQTGTGKTAGFVLPLLQRLSHGPKVKANHIRALILTPTRELAVQVGANIGAYGRHLPLKSLVVYGGVKINPQMMKLRGGIDVLVATPGRLLDLYRQNAVRFSQLETLILDEADRMLNLGFIDDISKIMALLPKKRQSLLFSATFSGEIRRLTEQILNKPIKIEVDPRNSTAKGVKQWLYEVDKGMKVALLSHLLRNKDEGRVLVFSRTKNGADQLVGRLKKDRISAAAIHGGKSQAVRSQTLADFKANKVRVLVATDIAARGIDIEDLPQVVNFDLPKVAEDYVHRIGRTGRAGGGGVAISLVSADEVKLLSAIETLIRQLLVREVETGFIPKHNVPLTSLKKAKPKKTKKQKQRRDNKEPTAGEPKGRRAKAHRVGKTQDTTKPKNTPRGRGKRAPGQAAASTKKRSASRSTGSTSDNKKRRS